MKSNKKLVFRKALIFLITCALLNITVGCCSTAQISKSFGERLKRIECVSSVTEIQQQDPIFKEKYIVTFTQPIDWNDLSKGTFEQRVEIGFQGYDNICNYSVSGYCLNDVLCGSTSVFRYDDREELCKNFNGNLINIEYRFFGESVPIGLSNDEVYLWDNLTIENAVKDIISITEKLSEVFTGKRYISGHSKGGFTVNAMSYFYPNSYDAFVSYVAPLCNGTEDSRIINAVFNTSSSDSTAKMQEILLNFDVFCIVNRAELEDMYYQIAMDNGCQFRKTMTKEILWDLSVLDFSIAYWQYGGDFSELSEILQMPDSTEFEHKVKMEEVINTIYIWAPPDSWCVDYCIFPYYWESFTSMGQYGCDFSFLRDAVIAETGNDMLAITEDMEDDCYKRVIFTEEQQKLIEYDDSIYKSLLQWSNNTTSNVIMIYGEYDPWYAVRIPETNNENIHIYCVEQGCHSSFISDLNEDDYSSCMKLLNCWL